jgi:hypothetical protein
MNESGAETQEAPDYAAMVLEEMTELELKRGRLAGTLRARAEEYDHKARALLEDRGEGIR